MRRFHEQMKSGVDVWPNKTWTLQDYKDMFSLMKEGYLVQKICDSYAFEINPHWDCGNLYNELFGKSIKENQTKPSLIKLGDICPPKMVE